jgi:uncharacterized 2Fe-2S/4Fe-4S cluster protein (DUF4445 family)
MIDFPQSGRQVEPHEGETLLQITQRAGLPLPSACGGKGTCGKCRIILEATGDKSPPPPTEKENQVLGRLVEQGYRLACETPAVGSARVQIPPESLIRGHAILTAHTAHGSPAPAHPDLKTFGVSVPAAEIGQPAADRELLTGALETAFGLRARLEDPHVLRGLPHLLRAGDNRLTAVVRDGGEIIALRAHGKTGLFGIAFDIGTTTVVGYLMDLRSGAEISVKSALNPQTAFGADVISRISHCQETPAGLERLRTAIVGCLNEITRAACREAGIEPADILAAAAVGNTAMHHLFFGLDPRYVAMAPYPAVLETAQDVKARELGLEIGAAAYLHLPPLKASFVGSDTVACILATRLHRSRVPTLLVDLGTNGEIVYGNKEWLACCSTAAGPAFEGGHIRWGMRAADGAIERVRLDPDTLQVEAATIGGRPPIGLCGSGIISATAELIRRGVLLQSGNFNPGLSHPRLRRGGDGGEFVLLFAPDTGVGADIVLTQKDISELIVAKAAIHAGASLLVERSGLGLPERILMAGACGNHIDPLDALTIDLLPGGRQARIMAVGNAAGHGACLALLDKRKRREAGRLARATGYLELAASPRFQELFVSAMFFTTAADYAHGF